MRPSRLPLALILGALPASPATADDLSVDVTTSAAVAAGGLAAWGAAELLKPELTPPACHWCEPPALDRNARAHLRWSDASLAGGLSDGLLLALPASLLATDWLLAGRDARRAGEDVLVVVEAVAATGFATQVLKYSVARRRPDAWASGQRAGPDDDNSFVSGHASAAFAIAAAFGTVARLRGYEGWPAVYAAGFAAAGAVSYLRVAADRHWLTDVMAGAALGTALGVALPALFHRRAEGQGGGGDPDLALTPVPLGVAGRF